MYDYFSIDQYSLLSRFITERVAEGLPFAVFRMPRRDNFKDCLIAITPHEGSENDPCRMLCKVRPWLSSQWYDFSATGTPVAESMKVCPDSTPQETYTQNLESLIEILKNRGGKTVIARNICGRFSNFSPSDIFLNYLSVAESRHSVTFLLYHPLMNFWMGSTPELILERSNGEIFRTMALAGTRHHEVRAPWDIKDIEEHELVARDIDRRLRNAGLECLRMPSKELIYGDIEHLATEFIADVGPLATDIRFFESVVDELEPTPALAGYPRPFAIAEIGRFEKWPRYLYAGCISICDIRNRLTYGIIRCVHFDSSRWAVYAGSGVTARSIPSVEWIETENKARTLVDCLSQF